MLDAKLDELVGPDLVDAYRQLFAADPDVAHDEMLEILAMFSVPQHRPEIANFTARVIMGLVGAEPHPPSWFKAVAAGSFELRPAQDYGTSAKLKSRGRLLSRSVPLFGGDVEMHRRAWAADVNEAQDGVRIVLFSMIAQELRTNVAAKAALGPAWPLMVAVNDFTADEKRYLYWFGADNRLQDLLAKAVREALVDFEEYHGCSLEQAPKNGDWERKLPPGANSQRYFATRSPLTSDEALQPGITSPEPTTVPSGGAAENDPVATASSKIAVEELSAACNYTTNNDGSPRNGVVWTTEELSRLQRMMPLLMNNIWTAEMTVAAARAQARSYWGHRLAGTFDVALYKEIKKWVDHNYPPPPELWPEHASLFEEEACLQLLQDRRYFQALQADGFLPDFDISTSPRIEDLTPLIEEWLEFRLKRTKELALSKAK